jgi:hypothetical protein
MSIELAFQGKDAAHGGGGGIDNSLESCANGSRRWIFCISARAEPAQLDSSWFFVIANRRLTGTLLQEFAQNGCRKRVVSFDGVEGLDDIRTFDGLLVLGFEAREYGFEGNRFASCFGREIRCHHTLKRVSAARRLEGLSCGLPSRIV